MMEGEVGPFKILYAVNRRRGVVKCVSMFEVGDISWTWASIKKKLYFNFIEKSLNVIRWISSWFRRRVVARFKLITNKNAN